MVVVMVGLPVREGVVPPPPGQEPLAASDARLVTLRDVLSECGRGLVERRGGHPVGVEGQWVDDVRALEVTHAVLRCRALVAERPVEQTTNGKRLDEGQNQTTQTSHEEVEAHFLVDFSAEVDDAPGLLLEPALQLDLEHALPAPEVVRPVRVQWVCPHQQQKATLEPLILELDGHSGVDGAIDRPPRHSEVPHPNVRQRRRRTHCHLPSHGGGLAPLRHCVCPAVCGRLVGLLVVALRLARRARHRHRVVVGRRGRAAAGVLAVDRDRQTRRPLAL
mmetsp:Transcript_18796/g.45256  ORF Transcript_18796/g.45256 Transcript_18796/m.45256 type:complete len:277 (+) Transcript_18796:735-1565(+)